MTRRAAYHRPIPGAATGHELAGQGRLLFDRIGVIDAGGTQTEVDADTCDPATLARLTEQRPDICGLTLKRPRIMGILNVTPDSFSDGGDLVDTAAIIARARGMQADILDIGGESTRPGADPVDSRTEIARVVPAIRALRDAGIATPISIDTRKADVAAAALDAGADMVNDVSAMLYDPDMAALVASRAAPICLMHAKGQPRTMQDRPGYQNVTLDVFDHLAARIDAARAAGIESRRIIADPGIGFGKSLQHNLTLLHQLALFHDLGVALLLGASRKRFIGDVTGAAEPKDRMPGSLAAALHGAAQGMQILRVHDVNETGQALRLHLAMNEGKQDDQG